VGLFYTAPEPTRGDDLVCYSNKIESVCLQKCPYDHHLTNKAYSSDITVTNLRVLPTKRRRKPTEIDAERNYVTVTLSPFPMPRYESSPEQIKGEVRMVTESTQ